MLYIIYGLTASVTKRSWECFEEMGIEKINKITYKTEGLVITPSVGKLNLASSEEEVRACDYVYEGNGRVVGFTSAQIEKAVSGQTDAVLTFSSGDVSFLREIKNAYGKYVTIIYVYIDDAVLGEMTDALDVSEEQKAARLQMGATVKKCYFEERDLFDEVLVYGGERSIFNLESIKEQYVHIMNKHKAPEKDKVEFPYLGNKPYVFVSYARSDTERVLPYLQKMRQNGCRIWYDMGIRGGDNWMTTLAMKIKGCSQYLLFSSETSVKSVWTRREASRALQCNIPNIITVRMDDARFDEGIEWGLEEFQQLHTSDENFTKKLMDGISDEVIERGFAE